MDIGAKINFVQYLNDKNINYNYLLFLHSKSDIKKEKMYFNDIVNNLDLITNKINKYELVIVKN